VFLLRHLQIGVALFLRHYFTNHLMDTQQDVRDVLARIVRIESTLFALTIASQTTNSAISQSNNALCNLQASVQHIVGLLAQPVIQLVQPPLVALNNPAAANVAMPLAGLAAAPVVAEQSSSQEAHPVCPFEFCRFEVRNCSAAKSLRHMQSCPHCPEPFFRYLHIAQHMCSFQKHPRVTDADVCCWCDVQFQTEQSDDSRSRHRHACREKATLCLQDVNTCQSMSNRLQKCWTVNMDVSSPPKRRSRTTQPPFSPPISPGMPRSREPAATFYRPSDDSS
jgi:hypothetical protein